MTKVKRHRNWLAVAAHLRSGAGAMKDKKKESNKKKARKKVDKKKEGH